MQSGPDFTFQPPATPTRPQQPIPEQPPQPPQQPSQPQQAPLFTPPPRSSGLWILAVLTVLGVVVAFAIPGLLRATTPDVVDPIPPVPVTTSPSTPTPTTTPTTPTPAGATAVPHGNGGAFIAPEYAQGATEFAVKGVDLRVVGAAADSSVVAVQVDDEIRGISAATTETVWTFPSFSCSEGSVDGVALCIDSSESSVIYGTEIPDMVGLDLATGKVAFNFVPGGMPGPSAFIGADEAHAYYTLAVSGKKGYEAYGQQNILALNPDGTVAWMTPLTPDGAIFQAALADDNRITVQLEDSIILLDRAQGAITFESLVADQEGVRVASLLWDGWLVNVGDDKEPFKVFDLEGALVAEYEFVNEYIPSTWTVGIATSVPVYERDSLAPPKKYTFDTWAVTEDGERAVGYVDGRIVDPAGSFLTESSRLEGVSADGGVFLSDLNGRSIHDAKSGEVLGGFASAEGLGNQGIRDGIVFDRLPGLEGDTITLLLPKVR